MATNRSTSHRKDHHLRVCLDEDVDFVGVSNGFERYRFDHDALPEIDKKDIQTGTILFGKPLSAPLVIGAMTGGSARAGELNRILAQAAESTGIGFALGSQRAMVENLDLAESYNVRHLAPSTLLLGNIGAVQLNYGVTLSHLLALIERTGIDVMAFHLNPLQEAIQPEGDTNFRGLMDKLAQIAPALGIPVLLKEIGAGISETTARKIQTLPITGLEVAGVGGTSWARVEAFRSADQIQKETGENLASWGIPTAESLVTCKKILPETTLICSGGMRSGLEAAKAIALGADAVAMAIPFLRAAQHGVDAVVTRIEQVIEELRTVMFVTGCEQINELRTKAILRKLDTSQQAEVRIDDRTR